MLASETAEPIQRQYTHSREAAFILGTGAGLGVLGDLLFQEFPLGLNGSLWIAALCLLVFALPRAPTFPFAVSASAPWLAVAVLFAGLLTLRASPVLQALNIAAVCVSLVLASHRGPSRAYTTGLAAYAWHFLQSLVSWCAGMAALAFEEVDWRGLFVDRNRSTAFAVGRGVAIALPLVVVFVVLLANADVFFSRFVASLVIVQPRDMVRHLGIFAVCAWFASGFLWSALVREPLDVPTLQHSRPFRLGLSEIAIIFGAINVVFGAFVAIQVRYLFGGASHVEASSELTYAEYARRGFFELVAVAALVLPLVLTAHWLLARDRIRLARYFSWLAGVVVVLLFVIIVSALERMRIYITTYGLTELRLYATAFMVWLAMTFAWLCLTLFRGHRDRFPFGTMAAGLVVVATLNAMNPDALIVRRNAAVSDTRPFDVSYALGLSADAIPRIVGELNELPADQRCEVERALSRRNASDNAGWRSWNWGRHRAMAALAGVGQAPNCPP